MGMAEPDGDGGRTLDDGKDHRTHRVYEGKVTEVREDDAFLDLDHGFEITKSGNKSRVWTDSSCWLKDLSGKRVRITIEVLE
jgi:hypothetical protein